MRLISLLAICIACSGQQLPSNWAGAGGSYNAASRPVVAGWFSYANLLSEKGQIYSITTHDLFLSQAKPYTVQSSVRTGIAAVVRQFGPITVLGLGDAGMAAGGSSIGGAFSGGGIGLIKLGKTNWSIALGARILQAATAGGSQTIYTIGFGRTF